MKDLNAETIILYSYFNIKTLSPREQRIAKPFADLATLALNNINDGPELQAGLRKLLEARDCFMRASIGLSMS